MTKKSKIILGIYLGLKGFFILINNMQYIGGLVIQTRAEMLAKNRGERTVKLSNLKRVVCVCCCFFCGFGFLQLASSLLIGFALRMQFTFDIYFFFQFKEILCMSSISPSSRYFFHVFTVMNKFQ